MRTIKAWFVVLALACYAWSSCTVIQHASKLTCGSANTSCVMGASQGWSPTGTGHLIVAGAAIQTAGQSLTSVTGPGTFSHCANCTGTEATGGEATDLFTTFNSTAASTITLNRNASGGTWAVAAAEISCTGTPLTIDNSGNTSTGTVSNHQNGVGLSLTGVNDVIIQLVAPSSQNPSAISQGYSVLESASLIGFASLVNTTNGTQPIWTLATGSARSAASAVAINDNAPPGGAGIKLSSTTSITTSTSLGKGGAHPKVLQSIAITPTSASIVVAGTALFTATGTFSDNSTADVTVGSGSATTTWSSSNTSVASVGAAADPQPVSGVSVGTSQISATLLGVNSNVATLSVTPAPLTITTTNCPLAANGVAYTCQLAATGGTPTYTWSCCVTGSLPGWASLNTSTGAITGTPNVNGTSAFTVKVTDSAGPPNTATQPLTISVTGGAGTVTDENFYDNVSGACQNMGATDGPATLPSKCFNTALANTPSPGGFFCVAPTGQTLPASCTGSIANYTSIAAAYSFASSSCSPASATCIPCGSTIKIVASSTGAGSGNQNIYDEAGLTVPPVTCNNSNWMTVITDMGTSLPPEQTRISPAWTNLATLPSRPTYNQPATVGAYMPMIRTSIFAGVSMKLSASTTATGPFTAYWRFIGLELSQASPGTLVCSGKNCQTGWQNAIFSTNCDPTTGVICPDHIILDRMIIDSDAHTGLTTNSVCFGVFGSATNYAVIDSYIYDIHSVSGISCEPHGISFGNVASVNAAQGPYKVINNFVEASAENFFTGGGFSVSSPVNLEIRRNHMFKPANLWMPFKPGYLGTPMLAKNVFETKDALQILVEGNIFENAWYGIDKNGVHVSDQFGAITLLHTKASAGEKHKVAAQDYTFRYNWSKHSARATDVAAAGCDSDKSGCGPTFPPGRTPGIIQRQSIHDNLWDDVSTKWFVQPYGGAGSFDATNISSDNTNLSVGTNGTNNSIVINHNTVIATSYSQDLTATSIITNGSGTATFSYSGSPPAGAGTGAGRKIVIFGACANFNEYATISTSVAGSFTYASGAPANTTCNSGFASLLQPVVGGAFNMNEASSDSHIISVAENGTLAGVLVTPQNSPNSVMAVMCVSAGVPAGCATGQTTTFTVYGLTGTLLCYNSNQANCGSGGNTTTPANWTLAGRVACTGLGTGGILGAGDASLCTANGQRTFWFNHIQSGLPSSTSTGALSFFSYWASLGRNNYGPDINPAWQGITVTNNILEGKIQSPNTSQCSPPGTTTTSAAVLNSCGFVATSGPGAANVTCNVIVSHAWTAQLSTTDTLPNGNVDTSDHTLGTVGFNNFNFDALGAGVTNLNDLALASSSSYFTGVSTAGCTSDGLPTGANMSLISQYTAGVN